MPVPGRLDKSDLRTRVRGGCELLDRVRGSKLMFSVRVASTLSD